MKKRFMPVILSICMILAIMPKYTVLAATPSSQLWDGTAATAFAGGTGTKQDPYLISNARELKLLSDNVAAGNSYIYQYFRLTNNIILNEGSLSDWNGEGNPGWKEWKKIGSKEKPLCASFDGGGYTISGLYINSKSDYEGLFGYTVNSTISNLGVVNSYISGGNICGGLVGYAENHCKITGCFNEAKVIAAGSIVGGLVGKNYGNIVNCRNSGEVICFGPTSTVGGIAGYNINLVQNSYNTGKIRSTASRTFVGGIVGENDWNAMTAHLPGEIKNCYNIGEFEVTNTRYVGSLVGKTNINSNIEDSYSLSSSGYGTTIGWPYGNLNNITTFNDANGLLLEAVTIDGKKYTNLLDALNANVKDDYKIWVSNPSENGGYPVFEYKFKGNGTADNPFLIDNQEQLQYLADRINTGNKNFNNKYYKLTGDIVLNDGEANAASKLSQWSPIGNDKNQFSGTFDGGGYTVSGIYINNDTLDYQGLFGYISASGTVKNLGIENSYIKANSFIGAVAGYSAGLVQWCNSSGKIYARRMAGGVVGYNTGAIEYCYNISNVFSEGNNCRAGGVLGSNNKGKISNCYNEGKISAKGLGAYAGGIVGNNIAGKVIKCYNIGEILSSGIGAYDGGVAGNNNDYIEQCYSLITYGVIGTSTENSKKINCTTFADSTGKLSEKVNINGDVCSDLLTALNKNMHYFAIQWFTSPIINGGYPVLSAAFIGSGTSEDPYLIRNKYDLACFSYCLRRTSINYCFKQTADIILNEGNLGEWDGDNSNNNWAPWSEDESIKNKNIFMGVFDGGGHTISGLYINTSNDDEGLFRYLGSNAVIKNIGVVNSYIKGGQNAGGIAAINNGGSIVNCYFSGTVSANQYCGGIAGANKGYISNCYNYGKIYSVLYNSSFSGGIAGNNYNGTINSSYSLFFSVPNGSISSPRSAGTTTDCATFENNGGELTLFGSGMLTKSTLSHALNSFVEKDEDIFLNTWVSEENSKTNNGYPTFGKALPVIKLDDKTATYNGKTVHSYDAHIKGSTAPVNYIYYTDSACTVLTSSANGAEFDGGAPKNIGTYYVKATVEEDSNFVKKSAVATLRIANEHNITVLSPVEGGSVSINTKTAHTGSNVEVSATTNDGYSLVYVTLDGQPIEGLEFVMPDHDVTVSARFEKIPVEDNENNKPPLEDNENNKPPLEDIEGNNNTNGTEKTPIDDTNNPATGDNSNITLWIIMLLAASLTIMVLYKKHIKKQSK